MSKPTYVVKAVVPYKNQPDKTYLVTIGKAWRNRASDDQSEYFRCDLSAHPIGTELLIFPALADTDTDVVAAP